MSNSVAIAITAVDPSVNPSPVSSSQTFGPAAVVQDQTQVADPADLRLVIEDDKAAGTFVYKTVDWRTGEVVQQLPREQVLRLREAENYSAGQVVATEA